VGLACTEEKRILVLQGNKGRDQKGGDSQHAIFFRWGTGLRKPTREICAATWEKKETNKLRKKGWGRFLVTINRHYRWRVQRGKNVGSERGRVKRSNGRKAIGSRCGKREKCGRTREGPCQVKGETRTAETGSPGGREKKTVQGRGRGGDVDQTRLSKNKANQKKEVHNGHASMRAEAVPGRGGEWARHFLQAQKGKGGKKAPKTSGPKKTPVKGKKKKISTLPWAVGGGKGWGKE